MFKNISEAPFDELIILRKDFLGIETPLIVVGEITMFKGKIHHLWRGGYISAVDRYKKENPQWDEKFDSFCEL